MKTVHKFLWPLLLVNLSIPGLIWPGTAYFVQNNTRKTFQPPSHANLEVLEKEPRKTLRLGPQTWRLFRALFTLFELFVVLSCCFFCRAEKILMRGWHYRAHSPAVCVSVCPQSSRYRQDHGRTKTLIPSGLVWQLTAFWFTVRLGCKTVRPWVGIPNRESHGQTVRVGRSAKYYSTWR